eukprot:scaffold331008_cov116-Cyclotella_meneghiniana.AAC.1
MANLLPPQRPIPQSQPPNQHCPTTNYASSYPVPPSQRIPRLPTPLQAKLSSSPSQHENTEHQ